MLVRFGILLGLCAQQSHQWVSTSLLCFDTWDFNSDLAGLLSKSTVNSLRLLHLVFPLFPWLWRVEGGALRKYDWLPGVCFESVTLLPHPSPLRNKHLCLESLLVGSTDLNYTSIHQQNWGGAEIHEVFAYDYTHTCPCTHTTPVGKIPQEKLTLAQ